MLVTVKDLLDDLYSRGKRKDIVSIHVSNSLESASFLMSQQRINLLAVKSGKEFVGVISTSDTSKELTMSSLTPNERLVSDFMTRDVITTKLDEEILNLPLKFKEIRHLVVVDHEGKWCAILDSNEVMKAVVANYNEREQLEDQVLGENRRRD